MYVYCFYFKSNMNAVLGFIYQVSMYASTFKVPYNARNVTILIGLHKKFSISKNSACRVAPGHVVLFLTETIVTSDGVYF